MGVLSLQHYIQVASPDLVSWLNYVLENNQISWYKSLKSVAYGVSFMAFDYFKRQKKYQNQKADHALSSRKQFFHFCYH